MAKKISVVEWGNSNYPDYDFSSYEGKWIDPESIDEEDTLDSILNDKVSSSRRSKPVSKQALVNMLYNDLYKGKDFSEDDASDKDLETYAALLKYPGLEQLTRSINDTDDDADPYETVDSNALFEDSPYADNHDRVAYFLNPNTPNGLNRLANRKYLQKYIAPTIDRERAYLDYLREQYADRWADDGKIDSRDFDEIEEQKESLNNVESGAHKYVDNALSDMEMDDDIDYATYAAVQKNMADETNLANEEINDAVADSIIDDLEARKDKKDNDLKPIISALTRHIGE